MLDAASLLESTSQNLTGYLFCSVSLKSKMPHQPIVCQGWCFLLLRASPYGSDVALMQLSASAARQFTTISYHRSTPSKPAGHRALPGRCFPALPAGLFGINIVKCGMLTAYLRCDLGCSVSSANSMNGLMLELLAEDCSSWWCRGR